MTFNSSLGCSDHAIVEFNILRGRGRKVLENVEVPDDRKRANITPIYKTGKKMIWEKTDKSASVQFLEKKNVAWVLIEALSEHVKDKKAFGMGFHNILVDSLVRYGLDKGHKLHGELTRLLSSKLLVANGSKSNLQLLMCRVPQGLTLGLILFNIFRSNLDERLKCICAKLADDTRLGAEVECEKEKPLYRDLDRLKGWANKVLKKINVKFYT
ncbi:hypothetical protein QYF61_012922 [Mycteria americana]|uniref:Reverse transcriptase domain-containing protein n=1 Tax=Mycteria americana TaxID=33587 RepID=A0AAN7SEM8_MYCAM|nr:hypothetical protein QYF61_012922 [Mycteria americana]